MVNPTNARIRRGFEPFMFLNWVEVFMDSRVRRIHPSSYSNRLGSRWCRNPGMNHSMRNNCHTGDSCEIAKVVPAWESSVFDPNLWNFLETCPDKQQHDDQQRGLKRFFRRRNKRPNSKKWESSHQYEMAYFIVIWNPGHPGKEELTASRVLKDDNNNYPSQSYQKSIFWNPESHWKVGFLDLNICSISSIITHCE